MTDNIQEGIKFMVWPIENSFKLHNFSAVFLPWFKFSLKTFIDTQNQGLSFDEKDPIALNIMLAIHAAHTKGIAHNNLTSSTILIDFDQLAFVSNWDHSCLSRNKDKLFDHN